MLATRVFLVGDTHVHGRGQVLRDRPYLVYVGIPAQQVQEQLDHAGMAPTHFLEYRRKARVPSSSPLLSIQQNLRAALGICPRCKG